MAAPSFKACVAADVKTFLNDLEFADRHTLDGRVMTVLVDENELLERDKAKMMGAQVEGIHKSRRLIYVAIADYGSRPKQGRQMELDNRLYRVQECTEEAGVLAIELEAITS